MFLLDTVVVSDLRRPQASSTVMGWMERQRQSDLFLSVITIGEIERGIVRCRARDPEVAAVLIDWLDRVLMFYGGRILPFDLECARRWGALSAALGNQNADLQIAATALEHGLTVATRDVGHFAQTGVAVFDPFSGKAYPPS
jgi:predicted nucleic acid-binding protein